MIQQLTPLGVDVPGGFGVSSTAYDAVLDQSGLRERLQDLLKDFDGTYPGAHSSRYENTNTLGTKEEETTSLNSFTHTLLYGSVTNLDDLAIRGHKARQMIMDAGLPEDVKKAIEVSYLHLCGVNDQDRISVAVRSSATAEGK
jgi:pyruvate, water dikinase